ncbi:hypothetical protein ACFC0C_31720 [Streptomyces sp. NPDC056178]|uniref:hypothetical protein n=1 Tax=Streptomyces sp. NPDC056178 TaxID=3345735 RepID=UPI0035DFD92A
MLSSVADSRPSAPAQDDVGDHPGPAALRQLVRAALYVGDGRAGMAGQLEADLLVVAFGERFLTGPREDCLDEALVRFAVERELHLDQIASSGRGVTSVP